MNEKPKLDKSLDSKTYIVHDIKRANKINRITLETIDNYMKLNKMKEGIKICSLY